MKTIRDNLGNDEKEQVGKDDKKERWTNIYKLWMKETVFLIMFKCVSGLIYSYSQYKLSD